MDSFYLVSGEYIFLTFLVVNNFLPYFLLLHTVHSSNFLVSDDSMLIKIVEGLFHFFDFNLEVKVRYVLYAYFLLYELEFNFFFELRKVIKGYNKVED